MSRTEFCPVLWQDQDVAVAQAFQSELRRQEALYRYLESHLVEFPLGLSALEFDQTALRQGTCALTACRARLNDQTDLIFPGNSTIQPVQVPSFSFGQRHDIHLAVPKHQSGQPNLNFVADDNRRYASEHVSLPDENLGSLGDDPLVPFRLLNARLTLGPPPPGFASLRLATVEAQAEGLRVVEESAPILADLKAWPPLIKQFTNILDHLDSACEMLSGLATIALGTVAYAEIAIRRDTLRELRLGLRQLMRKHRLYPLHVFEHLESLLTYLTDCSPWAPRPMVTYDHQSPALWMAQFAEVIPDSLSCLRAFCVTFRECEGVHSVAWDQKLADAAERLFLILRCPPQDQDDECPADQLRCCLASQIAENRQRRTSGIALQPVAKPPFAGVPTENHAWFQFDRPPAMNDESMVLESRQAVRKISSNCQVLFLMPNSAGDKNA